jgi:predicted Zn-dependent protease
MCASILTGCGSVETPWTRAPVTDPALVARASRVAAPLLAHCGDRPLQLDVLNSDVPAGYSWPDGRICVTRGLLDTLGDVELAAAIAHELGHLLNGGHLHGVAALNGAAASNDQEEAADDAGVRLLIECGLPPTAMPRMLQRVKDSALTPAHCAPDLERRADRLFHARDGLRR